MKEEKQNRKERTRNTGVIRYGSTEMNIKNTLYVCLPLNRVTLFFMNICGHIVIVTRIDG